jgi:hypothetical protein
VPKPDTHTRLAAALEAPESDIAQPGRGRSSSFTAQVADLALGETASKLLPVEPSAALCDIQKDLPAIRERLRNNVASSVRHAKARTGGNYSVEVCDLHTPTGQWFTIALVTRIE